MRSPSYYSSTSYGSSTSGYLGSPSTPTTSQQLRSTFGSPSSAAYATRTHLPFVSQSMLMAHCITGGSGAGSGTGAASKSLHLSSSSSSTAAGGYSSGLASRPSSTKRPLASVPFGGGGGASAAGQARPSAYSTRLSSYESSSSARPAPSSLYSASSPSLSLNLGRGSSSSSSSYRSGRHASSYVAGSSRPSSSSSALSTLYRPIRLRDRPLLPQISRQLNFSRYTPSSPGGAASRVSSLARRDTPSAKQSPTSEEKEASWSSDVARNISRNKYLIKFREVDKPRSKSPPATRPSSRQVAHPRAGPDSPTPPTPPPEARDTRERSPAPTEATSLDRIPETRPTAASRSVEPPPASPASQPPEEGTPRGRLELASAPAATGSPQPGTNSAEMKRPQPVGGQATPELALKLAAKPTPNQQLTSEQAPVEVIEPQPRPQQQPKPKPSDEPTRASPKASPAPEQAGEPRSVTPKPKKEPKTPQSAPAKTDKAPAHHKSEPSKCDTGASPPEVSAPALAPAPAPAPAPALATTDKESAGKVADKKPKEKRNIKLKIKTCNKSVTATNKPAPEGERRVKKATTASSAAADDDSAKDVAAAAAASPIPESPPTKTKKVAKVSRAKGAKADEQDAGGAPAPKNKVKSSAKRVKEPKAVASKREQPQETAQHPPRETGAQEAAPTDAGQQTQQVTPSKPDDATKQPQGGQSSPGTGQANSKRIRFREYRFEDFNFLSVLGHGGWGFVVLAELKDHDACFAVKCIKKITIIEDDDFDSIMIERKVLTLGNVHPFICKLFCTFETAGYLFFAMEYCAGGDLMFHVQREGKFTEARCRFYAAEIVCAIRFLHNQHIIYRDLKLDNILLDELGHVRLVDFGMCQCRTYREEMLPSNFCGTPEYISPEIIKGVPYNHSVDWWSFGVLLYEMAVGKMPFRGNDENELLWNVCYEQIHYPMFLTRELTTLLQALLEREPTRRMGMSTCKLGDIYDQAWFRSVDWAAVEALKVAPPFVPELCSKRDVQNFDEDFTQSAPELSPVDEATLSKIDQTIFQKFPFTNPNTLIFD